MNYHVEKITQHVLQLGISPTQMTINVEKKYKFAKMNEIISAVCALFNSGGGKVVINLDSTASTQDIDTCIRMIEQRIVEMVGITTMVSHTTFEVNTRRIILYVQQASELVSVNYNLYLPSERQVIAVPATEPSEEIKKAVQGKIVREKTVPIGSHTKEFVKGRNSDLHEGSNVEIKYLKASSSKCVTLADRITGKTNKFTSYISAFANHCGGHIYYGVKDDGIVEGETVTDKDKDEIIKKVTKTVDKIIWPHNCSGPQRGTQWEIFFEPVKDSNGNSIPSTFVIVIYVACCPGGVFTDQPESYYIVEGKVQKMSFSEWCRYLTGVSKRTDFLSVPSRIPRVRWSSEKNRELCRELSERLVYYRNEEDMKAFNTLSQLAIKNFPESDAGLIVKAEEVVVAYKHCHFRKAKSLLEEFAKLLTHSKDSLIFEVRMLLLRSKLEHSTGKCEDSYNTAQNGLQMMQQIPVDLTTVWFYIEAATVATTISTTAGDSQRYSSLKDEAQKYLLMATISANSLEDRPYRMSDLRQKLYIYKAWILLECSFTGQIEQQESRIRSEDIDVAGGELASVYESVLKGSPLTQFRKIQYHLVQCDLFHRLSEIQQENYIQKLKQAFEYASNARTLARKHHFENMMGYANKRLAELTEKFVRHAVKTHGERGDKTFFGLKY